MHCFKILDQNLSRSASLLLAVAACLAFTPDIASAQLAPNQTQGFGNGRLVTFTGIESAFVFRSISLFSDARWSGSIFAAESINAFRCAMSAAFLELASALTVSPNAFARAS